MLEPPTIPLLTLAETLALLRARLPDGSPVNNRDPFGVWETYTTLAAQVRVDDLATINALLPQGFPTLATGKWLDHHATSLDLTRIEPQRAEHLVHFVARMSGTVPKGSIVQTGADAEGQALRFFVAEDTDIQAPGGDVRVVAEQPGTAYNVGTGRITTLVTVLKFVSSVSNAAGSLTVAGVDRETDEALRHRLRLRWPALSRGSTWHSYVSHALEVPGITKVQVLDEHPRGQGTVDVIVAPVSGMPTEVQLAEVNRLVQARRPVTADVLVRPPQARTVNVKITLYLKPGVNRDPARWQAKVQQVFDALSIGQKLYPSLFADVLHNDSDVAGVVLSTPILPLQPERDELLVAGQIDLELL